MSELSYSILMFIQNTSSDWSINGTVKPTQWNIGTRQTIISVYSQLIFRQKSIFSAETWR